MTTCRSSAPTSTSTSLRAPASGGHSLRCPRRMARADDPDRRQSGDGAGAVCVARHEAGRRHRGRGPAPAHPADRRSQRWPVIARRQRSRHRAQLPPTAASQNYSVIACGKQAELLVGRAQKSQYREKGWLRQERESRAAVRASGQNCSSQPPIDFTPSKPHGNNVDYAYIEATAAKVRGRRPLAPSTDA